jgi:hypothetical protein
MILFVKEGLAHLLMLLIRDWVDNRPSSVVERALCNFPCPPPKKRKNPIAI